MQKKIFYITLLILAYFIYFAEGVAVNIFTIWNMLPLFVSLLIYHFGSKYSAYSFLFGSMVLSGYVHIAWLFNWNAINYGSTSALIFVVIPIYSLFAGGISYAVGRRFFISDNKNNKNA